MVRHFFLDKTNSIIYGSKSNTGLNPILKLNYGNDISRGLIHFDESPIRQLLDEHEITMDKSRFTLKMVNCFSVDGVPYEKMLTSNANSIGKRAGSFDLILFRLPQEFDEGRGFDFDSDMWLRGNQSHSEDGSSWYFAKNGTPWERDRVKKIYLNKKNYGDDINPDYEYVATDSVLENAVYVGEIPANKDITRESPDSIYITQEIDLTDGTINWSTIIRDKNMRGGIYSLDYIDEQYQKYLTYYKLSPKKRYYTLTMYGTGKYEYRMSYDEIIEGTDIEFGEYVYGRISSLPASSKAAEMSTIPEFPTESDDKYIKIKQRGCPAEYYFYKLMTLQEYVTLAPMDCPKSFYYTEWAYEKIDAPTDEEKCNAVEIPAIYKILTKNSEPIVKESNIIVGIQHFDYGMENLSIDITDYVNGIISEKYRNYGFGLAFAPQFERTEMELSQYVGFFTDHTNTFFHPYVEMVCDNAIDDDRNAFCVGKENKLYLYTNIDGEAVNLDNIPTCEINGTSVPVEQCKKGVYFARISPNGVNIEPGTVQYDKWAKIALNGAKIEDAEMEFEAMPISRRFHAGVINNDTENMFPVIEGINDDEKMRRGEKRNISVDFRKRYSPDEKHIAFNAEYRLYVKDGNENREYEVVRYSPIERAFLNNFFTIYTEDLIPNVYHIDIRLHDGNNIKYFKDMVRFEVVSDVTARYQ